jgi:hypothetical protein
MGFRIEYDNTVAEVPQPERYAGYSLESAYYDYDPAALSAVVKLDGYALGLNGTGFIELVLGALPLAEHLRAGPRADSEESLRSQLPRRSGGRADALPVVPVLHAVAAAARLRR